MENLSLDDIPYERKISGDSQSLEAWLDYYNFKKETQPNCNSRIWILERACRAIPRSYKLWKLYLDEVRKSSKSVEEVQSIFQSALLYMNKMPIIWVDYLTYLTRQKVDRSIIVHEFNRSLRFLPSTQHSQVWVVILSFAEQETVPGKVTCDLWLRYVEYDPSALSQCLEILLAGRQREPKVLEFLVTVLEDLSSDSHAQLNRQNIWFQAADLLINLESTESVTNFPDAEQILRSGLHLFPECTARIYVMLATLWVRRGVIGEMRSVFNEGIKTTKSLEDYCLLFESFISLEYKLLKRLISSADASAQGISWHFQYIENLLARRQIILAEKMAALSDNVDQWYSRIKLATTQEDKIHQFQRAIENINVKTYTGMFSRLWIDYAKSCDDFVKTSENTNNLTDECRMIFNKATLVPYKTVDELVDIYEEWCLKEIENHHEERAFRIIHQAMRGPHDKSTYVDYKDEDRPVQERIFKSVRANHFYAEIAQTCFGYERAFEIYERMFELKIATPVTVLHYTTKLRENKLFDKLFKLYERSIELFPTSFDIWSLYLLDACNYDQFGLERLRDLYEQVLAKFPSKPSLYIKYGEFEKSKGYASNEMKIYKRGLSSAVGKEWLLLAERYVDCSFKLRGSEGLRESIEEAINLASNKDAAKLCERWIEFEMGLQEFGRVRYLYKYLVEMNPSQAEFDAWASFEATHGNKATYREMLRTKRGIQAKSTGASGENVVDFVKH